MRYIMGKINTRAEAPNGLWNAPFKDANKDDIDLSCLVGKRIVAVGRIDVSAASTYFTCEADFAIDYQDGKAIRRVIIGVNDLGWWTEWTGKLGVPSDADTLRARVCFAWDSLTRELPKLVDNPKERRFSFVSADGSEILSLSIMDLKAMPASVRNHFTSKKPKDAEAVVAAIGVWAWVG